MELQALAYVGVRTCNAEDWASYGTKLVGLQLVDRTRGTMAFRMDDRKQRIVVEVDGGEGIQFFGWEVADATALDRCAGRLDGLDIRVERGSQALEAQRQVEGLIILHDPLGNRVEICHGPVAAAEEFVPGRSVSGFRTGALGIGHVVMSVEHITDIAAFYQDVLGFGVTDFYENPFSARFLHVNPRHHSLAFVQSGVTAVHHLMLEHFSLDDVGQGYDLAATEEGRIAVTLGRHCGDYMTSYYSRTPSGFMIEHGWGGRLIDPANWKPEERSEGPSLWGHERAWLPAEKRAAALQSRLGNAARGLRRPVQVIEGNYNRMPGQCPWWDRLHAGADAAVP